MQMSTSVSFTSEPSVATGRGAPAEARFELLHLLLVSCLERRGVSCSNGAVPRTPRGGREGEQLANSEGGGWRTSWLYPASVQNQPGYISTFSHKQPLTFQTVLQRSGVREPGRGPADSQVLETCC